jgi:hypothetical protein
MPAAVIRLGEPFGLNLRVDEHFGDIDAAASGKPQAQ